VHQCLREKINTTPCYNSMGYVLNRSRWRNGHTNGGVTLHASRTIDCICLYVKYAVMKLDTRASLYTSSCLCIHTCKSKCLRLASGAPWYVRNRQIHEDLCVPLFADHIRDLTASFDSKAADVSLGRYVTLTKGCPRRLMRKPKPSRSHHPRWPSRLNEMRSALITRMFFGYRDWGL